MEVENFQKLIWKHLMGMVLYISRTNQFFRESNKFQALNDIFT
jgi:hypothetical protein